jgi:beta-lactamase class A
MYKPTILHRFAWLGGAILIFAAGWFSHIWCCNNAFGHKLHLVTAKGFHFTSPLLDVELPEGVLLDYDPIPFKQKVESLVAMELKSGKAREVSVYYRDLHDGPWFEINQDWEFKPASLMKVPVMIAWLKRAETDREILNQRMIYEGLPDMSARQIIPPAYTIKAGQSYTIEDLLHYMINYSDNNAAALLYNALTMEELLNVLDGMDVKNKVIDDSNYMNIHDYSGFFRVLYNASFLSREMSEKALALLGREDFKGIALGVPSGIEVASKFGETGNGERGGERQLHDFGIVYHPTHPYILGVMTLGSDTKKQRDILRDISKLVYEEVNSNYPAS